MRRSPKVESLKSWIAWRLGSTRTRRAFRRDVGAQHGARLLEMVLQLLPRRLKRQVAHLHLHPAPPPRLAAAAAAAIPASSTAAAVSAAAAAATTATAASLSVLTA